MREAFLRCMLIMYPKGDVEPMQLRDLARTFSMGWVESAMDRNDREAVERYVDQFAFMAEQGWMPGDEWKWWPVIKLEA